MCVRLFSSHLALEFDGFWLGVEARAPASLDVHDDDSFPRSLSPAAVVGEGEL